MKLSFTLALLAGAATALAQTPITITQAQFPATAASIDQYQVVDITGVASPVTGPNRSWDYRTLTPQGSVFIDSYNALGANPPFAGSVRSYDYGLGPLAVPTIAYEGFDADGFGDLGSALTTQTYSLTGATGGANDVITYPTQTIPQRLLRIPLPMTSTTRIARFHRFASASTRLTIQSAGLNQALFVDVTRQTSVDSVAGWGTLRIPVAGSTTGSALIPVLLERRRVITQDSFYLNGQPAPASLLSGLGLTQGDTYADFRYRFFRQNASQPVLTFIYDNSSYTMPSAIAYSAEQNIPTSARAAREVAGGLLAWPNPAVAGQALQFTLGASGPGQPLHISLRDATGRVVAQVTGVNGQPTKLPLLPAGLYLAEAEAADGQRASRRLVLE